ASRIDHTLRIIIFATVTRSQCGLLIGLWLGSVSFTQAQALPSSPIVFADGHVTVGGDVSASFGSADPGFFDYTDYEHSALRLLRIDVSGLVKGGDHFALLGELRSENRGDNLLRLSRPEAYALYVRVRPWRERNF